MTRSTENGQMTRAQLWEMPRGKFGRNQAVFGFALLFAIWHVLTNVYLTEPGLWQNAIHFAGFAFLASVTLSPWGKKSNQTWAWVIDILYGLLVASAALWVAWAESGLYERSLAVTGLGWQFTAIDWAAGILLIFACIDLSRRVSGWVIPILIGLSLSYILFLGTMLPGVFRSASLPLNDVLFRTLYNDEGVFGILATISVTNITLFMIFGGFLVVSGASNFVIEVSKVVAGRIKGGAAFVAVISSALTGTISGSAIANTASTGVITIPLMKANGFRPQFAAGVEAAASTGGQLMPPIMGAGAFVMASYTSIPYGTIVAVSVVPAILYFLSVAFIVRIEAVKYDAGAKIDLTVDRRKMISGGLVFVIPLAVMIWLLLSGVTPPYAACWAIVAVIGTSWATSVVAYFNKDGTFKPVNMGPSRIAEALVSGIRSAIMTAILLTAIGIMNNAIVTSGVGNGFSLMIAQWSQGSLVLAIALIALASLVLGMGLPVTAAYIILAILTAPALAGIMADGLIVEQLIAGISDPSKSALFALVDHPLAAQVASGMTKPEAWELIRNIPFEIAVTIRPVLIDPSTQTVFLLTAHLIIFWLSQDSNVTPPVCLAAFTAAGIAGSRPMATGFESWKIAKGLYVVPLMFAYTPLISGELIEVLQIGFFALFGIYATNALIQWYAEGPLSPITLPLLVLGGIGTYWPLAWLPNIVGATAILIAIALSSRNKTGAHMVPEGG
ncbi:C4-dicarboxylate ABC transporter permease [Sulfitobacter sp. SK012]|uniref:TRAP transporter permease n=1 Tax=Sulfitobacter sp. SK012 TaxID=1389005 RepID=UPI000E0A99DB|nr:TRAP transporter fused permease subunit [Sulfitobacter sp. SK012]AXI48332.1 C4-dicarboxylate ABC transporter permease [Sulfitobacter sp. SK012]